MNCGSGHLDNRSVCDSPEKPKKGPHKSCEMSGDSGIVFAEACPTRRSRVLYKQAGLRSSEQNLHSAHQVVYCSESSATSLETIASSCTWKLLRAQSSRSMFFNFRLRGRSLFTLERPCKTSDRVSSRLLAGSTPGPVQVTLRPDPTTPGLAPRAYQNRSWDLRDLHHSLKGF